MFLFGQITRHRALHAVPDFTTLTAIITHALDNLLIAVLVADIRQRFIESDRQFTRFRIGEVITSDAGIKTSQSVDNQSVNRVAGGKCQTTENAVIERRKGFGMIFNLSRFRENLLGFFRVGTHRLADKDRRDVGTHRQQIINQLRYAVMIQTRQRFKNIQAGCFPEIIHFRRFTVLNG